MNLQSSHGVRQTGYGWFHGVSRVICDGYYIVLVVDHPHRWALASRSFFSSRNGTPYSTTTFSASPSISLAAHQGGSPAWTAAPTAITASSLRSTSARPALHFIPRGDGGTRARRRHKAPLPPPKQRASVSFSACVRVRLGRQLVLFSLAVAAHEVPHRASKSVMCQSS